MSEISNSNFVRQIISQSFRPSPLVTLPTNHQSVRLDTALLLAL